MPTISSVSRSSRIALACTGVLAVLACLYLRSDSAGQTAPAKEPGADRSPVDLILSPDGSWMATVNQTSSSVSLVDSPAGKVLAETACGKRPCGHRLSPGQFQLLVTGTYSGDLTFLAVGSAGSLKKTGRLQLGFEPRGVVVSGDGKLAYVALTTAHAVAVIDVRQEVPPRKNRRRPLAPLPGPVARWQTPGRRQQRRRRRGGHRHGHAQEAVCRGICRAQLRADADLRRQQVCLLSRGWSIATTRSRRATFAWAGCWPAGSPASSWMARPAVKPFRSIRPAWPSPIRMAWP